MASKTLQEATEETKLELTPMIDVTFLLLIFFMCSIKFKVLEGKLQTYLPKDVGVNTTPIDKVLEKIDIRIERRVQREQMNLEDINVFTAWKNAGGWKVDQVKITLQGETMPSLDELSRRLKKLREQVPAPPEGEEDELKMNLEPMRGVIYEDVVRVVDVALAAGFTSITFRGIEQDA